MLVECGASLARRGFLYGYTFVCSLSTLTPLAQQTSSEPGSLGSDPRWAPFGLLLPLSVPPLWCGLVQGR